MFASEGMNRIGKVESIYPEVLNMSGLKNKLKMVGNGRPYKLTGHATRREPEFAALVAIFCIHLVRRFLISKGSCKWSYEVQLHTVWPFLPIRPRVPRVT